MLRNLPKMMESLISQGSHLSERRDLNPRPLLPQSSFNLLVILTVYTFLAFLITDISI